MEEKRMLLIVNPVSGTLNAKDTIFGILKVFCTEGFTVTTALTLYRGHAKQLAKDAFQNGYKYIVCCGGDGTLNETISGMLLSESKQIPLGYIPQGSTNDFAKTLGLSGNPEESAKNIAKGNEMLIDVGAFGQDYYFSYIASFGAFTKASYSASQDAKNMVGHFAYLLEGIKDLPNLKSCKMNFKSDEIEGSGDYIFGAVSNTRSVGGIVKLKEEDIDLDDGFFELILVKNPKTAMDLNNIISGVVRSDFSSDSFEFFKTQKVDFSFEKELYWSLDGEKVFGGKEVHIENLNKQIRLLK